MGSWIDLKVATKFARRLINFMQPHTVSNSVDFIAIILSHFTGQSFAALFSSEENKTPYER
jgi:hypothetical protein